MTTPPDTISQSTRITLNQILPSKSVPSSMRASARYRYIEASLTEVGLIEPLVVYPEKNAPEECYILLDGHLRLDILKRLGVLDCPCLIALDDEAFTYNRHVQRLSPIQEHRMIRRSLEKGVPEERLSKALHLNLSQIRQKKNLLNGIAPEVAELLKDRHINPSVFSILKRMKPLRQIECVDLMIAANQFHHSYAQALLAATKDDQLVASKEGAAVKGLSADEMSRMESEMEEVQRSYRVIESTFGITSLNLAVAKGYFSRLLTNDVIQSYLRQHHLELAEKISDIAAQD